MSEQNEKGVYASLPLVSVLDKQAMKKAVRLLQEANELKEQIATLNERLVEIVGGKDGKEVIVGELERIQTDAGLPGLRWGDYAYRAVTSEGRATLDRVALMENGVTAEQIAASIKTGKGFVTRKFVNLTKGAGDDGD